MCLAKVAHVYSMYRKARSFPSHHDRDGLFARSAAAAGACGRHPSWPQLSSHSHALALCSLRSSSRRIMALIAGLRSPRTSTSNFFSSRSSASPKVCRSVRTFVSHERISSLNLRSSDSPPSAAGALGASLRAALEARSEVAADSAAAGEPAAGGGPSKRLVRGAGDSAAAAPSPSPPSDGGRTRGFSRVTSSASASATQASSSLRLPRSEGVLRGTASGASGEGSSIRSSISPMSIWPPMSSPGEDRSPSLGTGDGGGGDEAPVGAGTAACEAAPAAEAALAGSETIASATSASSAASSGSPAAAASAASSSDSAMPPPRFGAPPAFFFFFAGFLGLGACRFAPRPLPSLSATGPTSTAVSSYSRSPSESESPSPAEGA
mmetsp:Transcript_7645/g.24557  ORF Transcript_7645/g.24557 Transcript_7645/m.24557 type:complete len:380 (-) Transcript_7645:164-1303(-)